LPPRVTARVAIEAGVPQGWWRYAGTQGDVVAIENRYGTSAPYKIAFEKYGFTSENMAARALKLLGK
jgi:transketolase